MTRKTEITRPAGFSSLRLLLPLPLRLPLPLLLLLLLLSCGGRKGIIPQRKFVDLLVDIHLADGIAIRNSGISATYTLDSASLYRSVFRKHGVTKAQFDSTMSYYTSYPEDFQKLYNKVIARVKLMDADLAEQENTPQAGTEILIWQSQAAHALPQMGHIDKVEINVPIQGPGVYTVSAKIRIFKDDKSLNPRMSLYYYYDNKTPGGYRDIFPEKTLTQDDQEKIYSVSKTLFDAKVTHIRGFIVNHSNTDTLFSKHLVVSEVKVTKKKE